MSIKKSSKLDHIGYDIRGPVTDLADEMLARGMDILKLNTGNPAPFGFEAPDAVLDGLVRGLVPAQGYSDSKGIPAAREAVAAYCRQKGIPDVTPDDVYTGNGVSELITMSMQALLEDGDEVLVPAPDYPLWTAAVTLAGGRAVHYICDEGSAWYPDLADMAGKISPRTRAVVVINPNNPTGALYPREVLAGIAELARKNGLVLFSDEIYDRLILDDLPHHAMGAVAPDLFTVTFNGLSKSHLIAGYRAGWMSLSGPKAQARGYIEGLTMLASMRLCSNVPAQLAIAAALEQPDSCRSLVRPGGRIYEQRAYITAAINAIPGLSVVKPSAAFYLFPKIDTDRFSIRDDEQFVVDFLREQHVLLTHGGGFHWPRPDHFRIVFLPERAELETLAKRLTQFLDTYQQGQ